MFDFIHIGLIDIIDILLVSVLIFYMLRMLRGTQAMSIFVAIIALFAFRIICDSLDMELMSSLLGAVVDVGLIALIVIFQPEIRRFLTSLGSSYRQAGSKTPWLSKILGMEPAMESSGTINEICKACEEMSKEKCGVLIVIQKRISLRFIVETGDIIDARVSQRLLRNLFFKNSPLHDGAVIIEGDRVVAARCTLPISEKELPASFGMRHKAAAGISENTDAQVVVVSEETGRITVFQLGEYSHIEDINDLKLWLHNGH